MTAEIVGGNYNDRLVRKELPDRERVSGEGALKAENWRLLADKESTRRRVKALNDVWSRGEREAFRPSSRSTSFNDDVRRRKNVETPGIEGAFEIKGEKGDRLTKLKNSVSRKLGKPEVDQRFVVVFYSKLSILRCVREIKAVLRRLKMEFVFDRATCKLRVVSRIGGKTLRASFAFMWTENKEFVKIEIKQSKDDPAEVDWKVFTAFYKAVMVEFKTAGTDAIVSVAPCRTSDD